MYLMESPPGPKTIINGKMVDYFSGSGYFGLQGNPEVIEAACEAVKKYGISSATSPLVFGNNPVLQQLEANACKFFGTERVIHYVSGFFGNTILLEGLKDQYDIIFVDEESHYSGLHAASFIEKLTLPVIYFKHRDADDLKKKLEENIKKEPNDSENKKKVKRPLLLCDGIFPISGEISPIPDYREVLSNYKGAIICVDDAHATGVIGEKGHGTFEHFGLKEEKEEEKVRLYSAGTLSKAIGGHGGIIAGSKEFIEILYRNSKIPFAASITPIPAAAATAKALEILYEDPGLRQQLWDNVYYAREGLRSIDFTITDSPVPIICVGSESKKSIDLKRLQEKLFKKDLAVIYLPGGMYTSVPAGGAIRISIFSTHTRAQIDRLITTIKEVI